MSNGIGSQDNSVGMNKVVEREMGETHEKGTEEAIKIEK